MSNEAIIMLIVIEKNFDNYDSEQENYCELWNLVWQRSLK